MAEETGTPQPPPRLSYLEVICKSSGKTRRFAADTDAEFAVALINRKLNGANPLALHIEAVKEGEEPIAFGPNSVLVDYGDGWKLQTVTEADIISEDARTGEDVRPRSMRTPTTDINYKCVVPLNTVSDNKEGDGGVSTCRVPLDLVHDNEGVSVVSPPSVGMVFDSKEDIKEYYKRYANQQGFSVMTRSSKKGKDGKITYLTFACSREGTNKPKKTSAVRIAPSKKQKCDAKINACLCEGGAYRISSIMLNHNHDLNPSKSRLFPEPLP